MGNFRHPFGAQIRTRVLFFSKDLHVHLHVRPERAGGRKFCSIKEQVRSFLAFAEGLFLLYLQQKPMNAILITNRILEKDHRYKDKNGWVKIYIQTMALPHCGMKNNKRVNVPFPLQFVVCSFQTKCACFSLGEKNACFSPIKTRPSKLLRMTLAVSIFSTTLRTLNLMTKTIPISLCYPLSLSNHLRLNLRNPEFSVASPNDRVAVLRSHRFRERLITYEVSALIQTMCTFIHARTMPIHV